MVGRHHQLNGHEFGQTPGDGEGQGSLVVLQSIGAQGVGHNLATQRQTAARELCIPTWSSPQAQKTYDKVQNHV